VPTAERDRVSATDSETKQQLSEDENDEATEGASPSDEEEATPRVLTRSHAACGEFLHKREELRLERKQLAESRQYILDYVVNHGPLIAEGHRFEARESPQYSKLDEAFAQEFLWTHLRKHRLVAGNAATQQQVHEVATELLDKNQRFKKNNTRLCIVKLKGEEAE
jgi:hypothetical protein